MSVMVRKVLNVGGNNKSIPIPECFEGWQHHLLDIDPRGAPDVVCDARELWRLPPRVYDSVYCSHNLEHYYRHDVANVLKGFRLVLKKDGFVYVKVPDLLSVMRTVTEKGFDIDDVLYESPAGPILISDVIFGYHVEIERSGRDFYAHKTGFTEESLLTALKSAGFSNIHTKVSNFEIEAVAFLQEPTDSHRKLLGILCEDAHREEL